jgi:AraC family transcriptional regulator of arabinose operon
MLHSLRSRPDTREEIAAAALYMIFAELFTGSQSRPHYVQRTVETIDSLYMTPIRIETIAATLGIDRRYLARIFKSSMGLSVQDYLIRVRMEQAKKLLTEGLPVNLVAEMVGYSDPFNFSKMFKKYWGTSPKYCK